MEVVYTELQQLMYFKVAAECENLSKASEKLYISQPALSKIIQRLERDLETELFHRQGKTLRLNEAGKIVLAYTNEILQSLSDMRQSLHGIQSRSDHLSIVTNLPNLIRYVLPLCQKENRHLMLRGEYLEAFRSARSLLESNACDIVISDRAEDAPGLTCIPLLQDRLLLNVPENHPLLTKKWVDYHDLDGIELLETESTRSSRSCQIVKELLIQNKINVSFIPTLDVGSLSYLLEASDHCIVTSAMTSRFWVPPKRFGIPFRHPDAKIDYYALYLSEKSEQYKTFIKWLKNWCLWANQMFISDCPPDF